jgi:hypothetical protein
VQMWTVVKAVIQCVGLADEDGPRARVQLRCPSPKPSRDAAYASRADAEANTIALKRRNTLTHGCSAQTRSPVSTSSRRPTVPSGSAAFVAIM